jgi:hypothetical protein
MAQPEKYRPAIPENGMKTKTFTGNAPDAVIKAVHDWLSGQSGVAIRHTETRERPDPDTGAPVIEFEVQYEQAAPR